MKIISESHKLKANIYTGSALAVCPNCGALIEFKADEVQTKYTEEKVLANRNTLFDYAPATSLTCIKYATCPSCAKDALHWEKAYIVRRGEPDCTTVPEAKQLAEKDFSAHLFTNHWDGKLSSFASKQV